jgi:hypothetical protein
LGKSFDQAEPVKMKEKANIIKQTSSSKHHQANIIKQTSSSKHHQANIIKQTSSSKRQPLVTLEAIIGGLVRLCARRCTLTNIYRVRLFDGRYRCLSSHRQGNPWLNFSITVNMIGRNQFMAIEVFVCGEARIYQVIHQSRS